MEYKIEINGNSYVIKKLHELSISDYNKIFSIIEGNDYFSLLYMLTDIPSKYMDFIPEEQIKVINWNDILKEEMKAKPIKKEYLGRKLLTLDKINVGKFIELDYMLTTKEEDKMEYILSYMIRVDNESIEELVKEIKSKLKLVDIISPINYFINWRKMILKDYQSLFQIQEEPEEDVEEKEETQQSTDYGWIGIVYDSAGPELGSIHDVFDMKLIEFLNYLSWKIINN